MPPRRFASSQELAASILAFTSEMKRTQNKNIKFLGTLKQDEIPWRFKFQLPDVVLNDRNSIVMEAMSLFYTKEEIQQVLTNRRSDYSDAALERDFSFTEQPYHAIPLDSHFIEAIKVTQESFKPKEMLRPIAYPDLRYYPWSLPVSAEAPWNLPHFKFVPFQTSYDWHDPKWSHFKNKVSKYFRVREWLRYKQAMNIVTDDTPNFHNLYNEIFVYNRVLIHQIKYGFSTFWHENGRPKTYYWNTVHARSHVVSQDEPDKIRNVFGTTKLLLQAENMFIWQMQRMYLNEGDGRMLWGNEIMKGGWKKLKREIEHEGVPNTILSIDWSQFDRRLLFLLITIVHCIWRSYFNFDEYQPTSFYPDPKPESPQHIEKLWNWMCYSIKFNPMLMPDGKLYKWTWNGFGSGYQQTQLMDSFANMIMILTCLSSIGISIQSDRFWIRVQGDDSLIAFFERVYDLYGPNFLTMLAEAAKHYFNAILNVKKSRILRQLNEVSVLGYFNIYGYPFRTDEDLLRHLYFPERDQDWTRLAASAMGLAMASCGCSGRFYKCCKHIWNELVHKRKVTPKFSELRWMERAGMIERIDSLHDVEFPEILALRAELWCEPTREETAKQRLWPTKPGPAGQFYFLSTTQKFA